VIPILSFTVVLLSFASFISYKIFKRKKVAYKLKGTSIDVNSSQGQYDLNLNKIDYIHLFRTPGLVEYGFVKDIGLYSKENNTWTIIGHGLVSNTREKFELIQKNIIKKYTNLQFKKMKNLLKQDERVSFPSLVNFKIIEKNNHKTVLPLTDTDEMKSQILFDGALVRAYNLEKIQMEKDIPILDYISINNTSITVSNEEFLFDIISEVQATSYINSLSTNENLPIWMKGLYLTLLDKDKNLLAKLPLPSILNSTVLYTFLDEKFNINKS